jgi:citrate lyase gamma subunit
MNMNSDPTRLTPSHFQAHAELELLQLVLHDESPYPWNPAEVGADNYFAELEAALEREVAATAWMAADFASRGQALAQTMEQMWAAIAPAPASTLTTDLFQQFVSQVPQDFLEKIAQKARQVLEANLSLADQLVACVQEALPEWGTDDLQVLARPFAYAMRGAETERLEAALRSVRCAQWTELTSIEQARLSLAIARYAIAQVPSDAAE